MEAEPIPHSVLISLGHFELHFWLCQPQTRKTTVVQWKEVSNKTFCRIYPVRLVLYPVFFKSNTLFVLLTFQIKYEGQANHDTTFETS